MPNFQVVKEKLSPLFSKLSFLRLKKVWIPIMLTIEGIIVMNYTAINYDFNLAFIKLLLISNSLLIIFIFLFTTFSFFKLKKVWIPLIFILVGIISSFGLNYYENVNSCELSFIPVLKCTHIDIRTVPQFSSCHGDRSQQIFGCELKPLIILYPQKDTSVEVSLEYAPGFSATYPEYDTSKKGWSVLAHPDGTLIDHGTNQDTYGLFWEGNSHPNTYDLSHGFIVQGSEIRDFLYTKLTELGFNTKEKSDFIMYWYPKLQGYPYIQITFAGEDYTNTAKLSIFPTPDSLLRVFMVAKPLTEYKEIPEQKLQRFERKGFSVVEWGGTVVQ